MSPIRASERARYPADWRTVVVPAIRKRSGGRCECIGQCGTDHDAESVYSRDGVTLVATEADDWPGYERGRCEAMNHGLHPITSSVVVLTVAHLDHTPENCDPANLMDACQRCHLRYDAPHHAATRAARRAAELSVGTDTLFDDERTDDVHDS